MGNSHGKTRNMAIKRKKHGNETHTVGPVIWQENWQMRKLRNSHGRKWNMARSTEKHGK